jgi:hypothetical protein
MVRLEKSFEVRSFAEADRVCARELVQPRLGPATFMEGFIVIAFMTRPSGRCPMCTVSN